MQNLPILYSFVRCPYAMRARMALVDAGIECILREVNLRDKPKHLLEISPKGTVPVMLFPDSKILEESMDIVVFASSQNSMSEDIVKLVEANDTEFVSCSRIYKYPDRYPEEDAIVCRNNIEEKFLSKYESMLEGADYLLGDKTIADIALLPFVRQFVKVDEDWFYNSNYPNIQRWLKSFTESVNFKNIVMQKHDPWDELQPPTYLLDR